MNVERENQVAIERFVQYIQIKTVQPKPDYQSAFEFLKNYAEELDLEYTLVTTGEDRQAAVLTWSSSSDAESILLLSHIDVVPVFEECWSVSPFSGEIRDGKIYGRGTQDMKCVGIQYLEAIRRLKRVQYEPKRTIHCLFVPDEEIGGAEGMKKFVQLDQFKAMNVGFALDEGLANETDVYQVYYGNRGALGVDFVLKGNTGHGSRLIQNTAGEKAQFVINEMLDYRTREQQRFEQSQTSDHPLQLGNITTVNLTKMSGGVQVNVVPDQYRLFFDCRIRPGGEGEFEEFLIDLIRRIRKENDQEVQVEYLTTRAINRVTDINQP
ncbi:unnamed protein product [Adineta ricciae]|uniref:Peptidase M20 dimerisation domain-containing protein n=1 Tax=Adineta ricciae TaxID=249248 RepID=A0A814CPX9_ADIRI|nr:unnamed protein product [Adineta ricciae]CAF0945205.1 unnamed protein product [Adineta ricciae]